MSTLTERIQKAQGCGREDDPSQHGKPQPKPFVPEWRKHIVAKDWTRRGA